MRPIQVVFLWLEVRTIYTFRFNTVKMILIPIVYVLSVLAIQFYGPDDGVYLVIIQLVVALVLLVLAYRNELLTLRTLLGGKKYPEN